MIGFDYQVRLEVASEGSRRCPSCFAISTMSATTLNETITATG